jgi:hypothetical protein
MGHKIMRYILLTLLLIFSSTLFATNSQNACEYKKGLVTHTKIADKNINSYYWNERLSSESNEQITTLHIIYKNGDIATIEHKYCTMYNFEVSYLVADPDFSNSQENISKLMAQYFNHYAIKKVKFTPSLETILKNKMDDFSYSGNDNVELFIEQQSLKESSTYTHLITFYIGIGGIA